MIGYSETPFNSQYIINGFTNDRKYIENSSLKRRRGLLAKMGECGGKGTIPAESKIGDQVPHGGSLCRSLSLHVGLPFFIVPLI